MDESILFETSIVLPELNHILIKYLDPWHDYKNLYLQKLHGNFSECMYQWTF